MQLIKVNSRLMRRVETYKVANILIADDEELMRLFIKDALSNGIDNIIEYNPDNVDMIPDESIDVALIDIYMPFISGFELHKKLLERSPEMETIFISGKEDESLSEQVIEEGGHTFLTKPLSPLQVRSSVKAALYLRKLKNNGGQSSESCIDEKNGNKKMCCQPLDVKNLINTYAPLDVPILITGESGSGKEVVAECIHRHSSRCKCDMISLNCAALSPSLIESELFGHTAGSFTGASKSKSGYFEVADGGSLFLDEIGELPLELQAKLLRVLDKSEFVPVGSTTPKKIDIRIISATNKDLTEMVKQGTFRSDLYYRLHGANISLKPLREEKERIPLLVSFFFHDSKCVIGSEALNYMESLEWEGNIRELKTVCEILKATCTNTVTREDIISLTGTIGTKVSDTVLDESYKDFKDHVVLPKERLYFENLLNKCRGNISQVSRISGISRRHLYDKLNSLDLI